MKLMNKDVENLCEEENKNVASFYSQEERSAVKCARVKIEQKENIDLDYNSSMKVYVSTASPLTLKYFFL